MNLEVARVRTYLSKSVQDDLLVSGPWWGNIDYFVLGIDYDSYLALYTCAFGVKFGWIFTRVQQNNKEAVR
jgi:hypothetical protein